ncbi:hypothetical protein V1527DRAFT_467940 [Lipomyces starkeyi]
MHKKDVAHERRDGSKYSFGCPASVEYRPAVRDPSTIQRYTGTPGELSRPELWS